MHTKRNSLLMTTVAWALIVSVSIADDSSATAQKTNGRSTPRKSAPVDVSLREDGVIRGRVVQPDGTPLDGARVTLRQGERKLTSVMTDSQGGFEADGLPHGLYRIDAPTASRHFRFWRNGDAPPKARPLALVVSQEPTLRGQYGYRNIDLLTLGLGAAGTTLGVLALDKAEDAENRMYRMESDALQELASP